MASVDVLNSWTWIGQYTSSLSHGRSLALCWRALAVPLALSSWRLQCCVSMVFQVHQTSTSFRPKPGSYWTSWPSPSTQRKRCELTSVGLYSFSKLPVCPSTLFICKSLSVFLSLSVSWSVCLSLFRFLSLSFFLSFHLPFHFCCCFSLFVPSILRWPSWLSGCQIKKPLSFLPVVLASDFLQY